MLAILEDQLGYRVVRRVGSHRRLAADGRPTLTFAFHDKHEVGPGVVRDILVKQVGLTLEAALEVVQDAH